MAQEHSAPLARLDALTGADGASMFAELIRTDTRTTHRNW